MVTTERFQGVVTAYNVFDGAGTIAMPDGREVTVRYSSIRGEGVRKLCAGAYVTFLLQQTRRGLYAVCVQQE